MVSFADGSIWSFIYTGKNPENITVPLHTSERAISEITGDVGVMSGVSGKRYGMDLITASGLCPVPTSTFRATFSYVFLRLKCYVKP